MTKRPPPVETPHERWQRTGEHPEGGCNTGQCIYCTEPDYEALGYPETRAWRTLFDDLEMSARYYYSARSVVMPMYLELKEDGKLRFVVPDDDPVDVIELRNKENESVPKRS